MSQFNVEALSQLRWLVTGFSLQLPGFNPRSDRVGLLVDKVILEHVSPSTLVSSTISHHPGLV
jgi:hypothetical protein